MAAELDLGALQVMSMASEIMKTRAVVKQQRSIIWGLMTIIRAERRTNAELLSLLESMLGNEFGDA